MTPQQLTVSPVVAPPAQPDLHNLPLPKLDGPSSSPSSSTPGGLPKRLRPNRGKLIGIAIAGMICVAVAIGAGVRHFTARQTRTDLVTHKVQRGNLDLTIVERGALESADNRDVYCRVKAGAKNSTVATTIKSVIDDGSHVKKGELIVELDDSGLIEQLKAQKIVVDQADSARIQADEGYKIVCSQNDSDIKAAEIDLELKTIDLEKYLKGDYPQSLSDVQGRIKVAESDLEMQRERSAWSQRMMKKGYQTASQSQAEQAKLESYELNLRKLLEEKRVLTDDKYGMKKRTETDLRNKVEEAHRALARIKGTATAKEVQARTERETKKSIYQQELSKYKETEEEITKCKILAPQDGMVVYYIPEQARFGGGSQQSIVAQGEPVREGQKLMQIPNLSKMIVNTKVHEALVSKVQRGQTAKVRVDAFPDRSLAGRVEAVATISSQADWISSDVKVYATKVAIEEEIDGLKPGMSAEVTITIGDALQNVLTVPVQAIVGSVEMGKYRQCFVMTPDGPEERQIVVGMSNDRIAEVQAGLKEGEEVILNPKVLVGDKSKTRQPGQGPAPSTAPTDPGKPSAKDGPASPAAQPSAAPKGIAPQPRADTGSDGGAAKPSAEDRQRRQQQQLQQFKAASPEQRKQMLEQVPEQFRDRVRELLKSQGIEIPN